MFMKDFYQTCRPSVKAAILSIQFVEHLKQKEHLKAIQLIQKTDLKTEAFPSVDLAGGPILCQPQDLTKLFCKSDLNESREDCALVGEMHRLAVCSFVNKEMLEYENN